MIINLYSNNKIIKSVNLDIDYNEYHFLNDSYAGKVKESVIEHEVKCTEDLTLLKVCEDLNTCNLDIVDKYELKYDDRYSFIFVGGIKRIMCRTMSYLNCGNLIHKETLSIRVFDDEQSRLNPNRDYLCCEDNCPYLNNHTCKKYDTELSQTTDNCNIVCESCFLNSSEAVMKKEVLKAFNNNRRLYDSTSEIKGYDYNDI